MRFEPTDGGGSVAEVMVSRDPEQYRSTDGTSDALLLAVLLDGYDAGDHGARGTEHAAREAAE